MRKLNSFTVLELLVVMGVSAIIIGSATYLTFSFQSFLNNQNQQSEEQQKIISFYSDLLNEAINADYFSYNNDEIILVKNESSSNIYYTDTILYFKKSYQNQQINVFDFQFGVDDNEDFEKLNQFNLNFSFQNQKHNWYFNKQYSTKEKINQIYAEY